MNIFAIWTIETCIVTALLTAVVWIVCLAFRRYPAVQHTLWLVVLLRFLLPPVISSPWSIENAAETLGYKTSDVVQLKDLKLGMAGTSSGPIGHTTENKSIGTAAHESIAISSLLSWSLVFTWSIGAIIALAIQTRRILAHRKLIYHSVPGSPTLRENIGRLSKILGIRSVHVAVVGRIGTPFVWFLGRTYLVWPTFLASEGKVRQSRSIIAHELAHIQRRDHWIAWLDLAAGVIWWWNPVFRLVRRKLHESAEMSCDAIALNLLPDERQAYAEMFLQLSSNSKIGMPAPVLGMSTGTPSSFERRLSMILSDSVSCKLLKRGFLLAGVLALAALPTWSLGQSKAAKGRVVFKVVDSDSGAVVFEVLEVPSGELVIQELNENSRDPLVRKLKSIITRDSGAKESPEQDWQKAAQQDAKRQIEDERDKLKDFIKKANGRIVTDVESEGNQLDRKTEKIQKQRAAEAKLEADTNVKAEHDKMQAELMALSDEIAKQVADATRLGNLAMKQAAKELSEKRKLGIGTTETKDDSEKIKTAPKKIAIPAIAPVIEVRKKRAAEAIANAESEQAIAMVEHAKRAAEAIAESQAAIKRADDRLRKSTLVEELGIDSKQTDENVEKSGSKVKPEALLQRARASAEAQRARASAEAQRAKAQSAIAKEIEQLQKRIRELESSNNK